MLALLLLSTSVPCARDSSREQENQSDHEKGKADLSMLPAMKKVHEGSKNSTFISYY